MKVDFLLSELLWTPQTAHLQSHCLCIASQLCGFPLSCFASQLFNLSQGLWLWLQPTHKVVTWDKDSLQHLDTAVCCYSCYNWRCFLDERSENTGAQQLFTRGILCHPFSLMWPFSSLLPFCCLSFFFSPRVFSSPHHLSVRHFLNQFAHSWRPLPQLHPWHFQFSLQNLRMICKSESIYPEFLDVCQTILEQQHDLFCAQISTVYTLLALLREARKGRDRHGENILSIYRILAARHQFVLPMM